MTTTSYHCIWNVVLVFNHISWFTIHTKTTKIGTPQTVQVWWYMFSFYKRLWNIDQCLPITIGSLSSVLLDYLPVVFLQCKNCHSLELCGVKLLLKTFIRGDLLWFCCWLNTELTFQTKWKSTFTGYNSQFGVCSFSLSHSWNRYLRKASNILNVRIW